MPDLDTAICGPIIDETDLEVGKALRQNILNSGTNVALPVMLRG